MDPVNGEGKRAAPSPSEAPVRLASLTNFFPFLSTAEPGPSLVLQENTGQQFSHRQMLEPPRTAR